MHRTRAHYWSCSSFAHWLRQTLGASNKPNAATMEEWSDWRTNSKTSSPFVHWLTEEFLDKVQNVLCFPGDVWNEIRYYIKNRFFDKMHYLQTRLEPGKYYDLDTRLLHGLFESLVDFVEVEKAHMQQMMGEEDKPLRYRFWFLRFSSIRSKELGFKYLEWEATLDEPGQEYPCNDQAKTAREIMELYTWWKEKRPARPDPYDITGWTEYCASKPDGELFWATKTDEERAQSKSMLDQMNDIEKQYDDEDEQMMLRLIKIRKSLWT